MHCIVEWSAVRAALDAHRAANDNSPNYAAAVAAAASSTSTSNAAMSYNRFVVYFVHRFQFEFDLFCFRFVR